MMKIEKQIQSLLPGATILGTILLAGAIAPAATILQTVTEGTGIDWTAASWGGPPAAAATSGNNYESPSSFTVRTPNKNLSSLYSTNFASDSLQIDAGSILYLKHGGKATNPAGVTFCFNRGPISFPARVSPPPPAVEV